MLPKLETSGYKQATGRPGKQASQQLRVCLQILLYSAFLFGLVSIALDP